jgi:hypothetical protein
MVDVAIESTFWFNRYWKYSVLQDIYPTKRFLRAINVRFFSPVVLIYYEDLNFFVTKQRHASSIFCSKGKKSVNIFSIEWLINITIKIIKSIIIILMLLYSSFIFIVSRSRLQTSKIQSQNYRLHVNTRPIQIFPVLQKRTMMSQAGPCSKIIKWRTIT